jgi:hypothetical protein
MTSWNAGVALRLLKQTSMVIEFVRVLSFPIRHCVAITTRRRLRPMLDGFVDQELAGAVGSAY